MNEKLWEDLDTEEKLNRNIRNEVFYKLNVVENLQLLRGRIPNVEDWFWNYLNYTWKKEEKYQKMQRSEYI